MSPCLCALTFHASILLSSFFLMHSIPFSSLFLSLNRMSSQYSYLLEGWIKWWVSNVRCSKKYASTSSSISLFSSLSLSSFLLKSSILSFPLFSFPFLPLLFPMYSIQLQEELPQTPFLDVHHLLEFVQVISQQLNSKAPCSRLGDQIESAGELEFASPTFKVPIPPSPSLLFNFSLQS